ncbi:DNase I-like protein, partial [Cylindrobasidium torrendii FP15055 ss-10]
MPSSLTSITAGHAVTSNAGPSSVREEESGRPTSDTPVATHGVPSGQSGNTTNSNPPPRNPSAHPKELKTKAHLKIGSLNVNGYKSESRVKLLSLPGLMFGEKFNVVALQETHLNQERVDEIDNFLGDTVHLEWSAPPSRETQAEGIALAFNKKTTLTSKLEKREVIPGRCMVIRTNWHGKDNLNIMVAYAPNTHTENALFWKSLKDFTLENSRWTPDVLCTDANVTLSAIDRIPERNDNLRAAEEMSAFLLSAGLIDGWRNENDTKMAYTFTQKGGENRSSSRIDRIYVTKQRLLQTRGWNIETPSTSGIQTDHRLVSCMLTLDSVPEQGHGRYTIPSYILDIPEVSQEVTRTAKAAYMSMLEFSEVPSRNETMNPQKIYQDWKESLVKYLRVQAKKKIPNVKKKIAKLQNKI